MGPLREFPLRVRISPGASFMDGDFEFSQPNGWPFGWSHQLFVQAVKDFLHSLIGPTGRAIRCPDLRTGLITMSDNTFNIPFPCLIEVADAEAGAWGE